MAKQTWAAWILDSYASSEADVSDSSDTYDEDAIAVSAPSSLMSQQQSSPFGPFARTGRGGAGNYHWHSDLVPRRDDIEALDLKQSSISERRQAAAKLEQLQTAEALKSSQSSVYSVLGRGGAGNYRENGSNDVQPAKTQTPSVVSARVPLGPRTFGRGGAGNLTAARDAKERLEDERRQNERASAERTREEIELQVLRTLQTPPGAILGHSQRSSRLLDAVHKEQINHHYQASMHSGLALSGFVPKRLDTAVFVGSCIFERYRPLLEPMSNTHLLEMAGSNNPPTRHGLSDLRLPVRLRGEIAPPLTTPRTAMATNTSRQSHSQFSRQEIEDLADTASNISPTQPVQHGPPSPPTNYTSFADPASVMLDYRPIPPPVDADEEDRPPRSFRRRNALIPNHTSSPNSLPTSPLSSNSTFLTSIHDDLSDQRPPSPHESMPQNTMPSMGSERKNSWSIEEKSESEFSGFSGGSDVDWGASSGCAGGKSGDGYHDS
ncbi:hypothetical protein DV736_g1432, partial [Chaetothyriales sp. CBS 134916]